MINRRTFCRYTAAGSALLVVSRSLPAMGTKTVPGPGTLLLAGSSDTAGRLFSEHLKNNLGNTARVLHIEHPGDMLRTLPDELRGPGAGKSPLYIIALVTAGNGPIMDAVLREAQAAILVNGQHVQRNDYESHVFTSTPPGHGVAGLFRASAGPSLPEGAVREHKLGNTSPKETPVLLPAQVTGDRLLALARVYCGLVQPGITNPIVPLSCATNGGVCRMNHESYIARLWHE